MKVCVNQKACIQCGLCPVLCPAIFSLEPGIPAQAVTDDVPKEQEIAVRNAADNCPTEAITIQ